MQHTPNKFMYYLHHKAPCCAGAAMAGLIASMSVTEAVAQDPSAPADPNEPTPSEIAPQSPAAPAPPNSDLPSTPDTTAPPLQTMGALERSVQPEKLAAESTFKARLSETGESEDKQLRRLESLYNSAASVFGTDHVLATPILYAGKRCTVGLNILGCDDKTNQGGVGGLIVVPLFGAGGGHGADWWPAFDTDAVMDGFNRFEREFRALRNQMLDKLDEVQERIPDSALEQRFQRLVEVFTSVLERHHMSDPYYYSDVQELRACLDVLVQAPLLRKSVTVDGTPEQACLSGIESGRMPSGWTPAEKLKLLEALWKEFDTLIDSEPVRRHTFLIGPTLGVPLTEESPDLLYGVALEVGSRDLFRATASAGLRSSMQGSLALLGMDNVGFWFGIGLSGTLGTSLVNSVLGAGEFFNDDVVEAK